MWELNLSLELFYRPLKPMYWGSLTNAPTGRGPQTSLQNLNRIRMRSLFSHMSAL